MIRKNVSFILPAVFLTLVFTCLTVVVIGDPFYSPLGFSGLMMLSAPWSLAVFFFLAWGMMHDGTVFGVGIALFLIGALVNSFFVYKIGASMQSSATSDREE